MMITLIQIKVYREKNESEESQCGVDVEGPEEIGVCGYGGDVRGVDYGGEEGDCEVGGEEMGFVEAVEEDYETHFGEVLTGSVVDGFGDVGGGEVR
jgi:hypothetical protein